MTATEIKQRVELEYPEYVQAVKTAKNHNKVGKHGIVTLSQNSFGNTPEELEALILHIKYAGLEGVDVLIVAATTHFIKPPALPTRLAS